MCENIWHIIINFYKARTREAFSNAATCGSFNGSIETASLTAETAAVGGGGEESAVGGARFERYLVEASN